MASAQPARRLLAPLWEAARGFWSHNCFNDCAAISYYALLSIVPLLSLVSVVVTNVLGIDAAEVERMLVRAGVVVPQFEETLQAAVSDMVENRLSIGLVSLITTIWFSSLVFYSIQGAFDRIFRTAHPPLWGAIKPQLVAFGAAGLMVVGFFFNTVLTMLRGLSGVAPALGFIDRLPWTGPLVSFALDVTIFAIILAAVPTRRVHARSVLVAALIGTCGWRAAGAGFGIYIGYASRNFSFAGSAGAALAFMLWIYYAAMVLLYSGELLAALESRRSPAEAP
ncbi:MAG: YihY/virulence factor BrkB family protein [Acidobacteriota bacterium]